VGFSTALGVFGLVLTLAWAAWLALLNIFTWRKTLAKGMMST
jgi:hypothetical protein